MSDEKVVINADDYAAMRKELVVMIDALDYWRCSDDCTCPRCNASRRIIDACPVAAELSRQQLTDMRPLNGRVWKKGDIAAKLSEEEGGNG